MSSGITFNTLEEAEERARFLREQGQESKIVKYSPSEYKLFYTSKGRIISEPEELGLGIERIPEISEEEEIKKGIAKGERRRTIEKALRLPIEEEIEEEKEIARRKLKVKKAMEKEPEEVAKATLMQKREALRQLVEKRRRQGQEPGVIVPVFDPETRQIKDYELQIKGIKQRIGEGIVREFHTGEKQIEIKEAGISTLGTTLSHMEGIKGGIKAQALATIGEGKEPRAVIARLPGRIKGAIGTERPAIGKMGTVDFGKTGTLYIGKSPIKSKPEAKELEANGRTKIGFTKIPILKNPKGK